MSQDKSAGTFLCPCPAWIYNIFFAVVPLLFLLLGKKYCSETPLTAAEVFTTIERTQAINRLTGYRISICSCGSNDEPYRVLDRGRKTGHYIARRTVVRPQRLVTVKEGGAAHRQPGR